MNNLALSASWNAFRHENGSEIIREIAALGFKNIELSFNLTASLVDQMYASCQNTGMSVVSVHNYCPIPTGIERQRALPDCFSLASLDEHQRSQAVLFAKRSVDTAERFKARAVVLHAGRVDVEDKTRSFIELYNKGLKETVEYQEQKEEVRRKRLLAAKPHMDQAIRSLDELSSYADSRDVALGIETRYYLREIPSFEELEIILSRFQNRNVYYWHDVGHAQLWDNLGFHSHESFLEKYADRMIGIHLHDISGSDDHRAPLQGDFDFIKIIPYLKKDTIKVIEAHAPATEEDIRKASTYLSELMKAGKL
ncbi:sugar phosphate isomerase/epimerase family protein [Candidatus Omnitrophota bacterium]